MSVRERERECMSKCVREGVLTCDVRSDHTQLIHFPQLLIERGLLRADRIACQSCQRRVCMACMYVCACMCVSDL